MQGCLGFGSHLRGQAQHLLHQLLRLSGLFQEQFHNCREQLELHLQASQTHNKRMLKLHLRCFLEASDENYTIEAIFLHCKGNKCV